MTAKTKFKETATEVLRKLLDIKTPREVVEAHRTVFDRLAKE